MRHPQTSCSCGLHDQAGMRHPVPIPGHPGPQQDGVVGGVVGGGASPMVPLDKLMVDSQPHPLCRKVILSRIWSVCVGWSVVGTGQEMQGQRVTVSASSPWIVHHNFLGGKVVVL